MHKPAPRGALPVTTSDRADRVRALARLLDAAVRVPGTNVRVGLDAVVGLVPALGDVAGAAFSGYIILAAARLGAPTPVLLRMLLNVTTDTVVGSVPLLGDLFDLGWRANTRNVALLDRHLADPAGTRAASRWVVVGVVGAVVILAAAAVLLTVLGVRALASLATAPGA
jgi:hypothetical protein